MRRRFNSPESQADAGHFSAKAEIRTADSARLWNDDALMLDGDLLIDRGALCGTSIYSINLRLNGDLAYVGDWSGAGVLL